MQYTVHPITATKLQQNHPWVTKDSYSLKFPQQEEFIHIKHPTDQSFLGCIIHSPQEKNVIGRFWSKDKKINEKIFIQEFENRLKISIEKRKKVNINRENFYFVFGESDQLPGLFILCLKNIIIVQTYLEFWKKYWNLIPPYFKDKEIYFQFRQKNKMNNNLIDRHSQTGIIEPFELSEFGIKYLIDPKRCQDFGIYTDISSIKSKIIEYFKPGEKLLNLFAYSGSFSLLASQQKMKVTNVDFSKNRIEWVQENYALNNFNLNNLEVIQDCSSNAILKLIKKEQKFHIIISDPPTSFTLKQKSKRMNAFSFHQLNMQNYTQLLEPKGYLLLVINTHSLTKKHCRKLFQTGPWKLIKSFEMQEDCIVMDSFPEGNYIKTFLLQKK